MKIHEFLLAVLFYMYKVTERKQCNLSPTGCIITFQPPCWVYWWNFKLFKVISYFLSLTSEAHSEAWTPVLLLLFTQLARLEDERLRIFSRPLYPLLCQIWCVEVRPEVCSVLRNLFLKIGSVFGISAPLTNGSMNSNNTNGPLSLWNC